MARRRYDVAVMHDFFVDRLVHTDDVAGLFALARSKARQGGGSIHGIGQADVSGGNAVNLAHALAVLGARVLLITHSGAEHVGLLRHTFENLNADVRVKELPAGLTVALEERVNVMMSDSRGAAKFLPSMLTEEDWEALRRASVVCSTNWAANEYGTHLLVALRKNLGDSAMLHFNPADVRDRAGGYRALMTRMKKNRLVDWLSVNEYEARSTASALGLRGRLPERLCAGIADQLHIRVDVHTEAASYTSSGGRVIGRRTRRVIPKRLTGAGDVWDAASIFGRLRGMEDGERLDFANAAGRLYVAGGRTEPPTLGQINAALS